jgi:acyl-ACP thioesterase
MEETRDLDMNQLVNNMKYVRWMLEVNIKHYHLSDQGISKTLLEMFILPLTLSSTDYP